MPTYGTAQENVFIRYIFWCQLMVRHRKTFLYDISFDANLWYGTGKRFYTIYLLMSTYGTAQENVFIRCIFWCQLMVRHRKTFLYDISFDANLWYGTGKRFYTIYLLMSTYDTAQENVFIRCIFWCQLMVRHRKTFLYDISFDVNLWYGTGKRFYTIYLLMSTYGTAQENVFIRYIFWCQLMVRHRKSFLYDISFDVNLWYGTGKRFYTIYLLMSTYGTAQENVFIRYIFWCQLMVRHRKTFLYDISFDANLSYNRGGGRVWCNCWF